MCVDMKGSNLPLQIQDVQDKEHTFEVINHLILKD